MRGQEGNSRYGPHNLVGLAFDDALRIFLEGFRLPREPERIDRMMEKFAEHYCKNNPEMFSNADSAYVLAYAVIMLHTDAHSSQVKNKMTKETFIKNAQGISDDLEEDFLSEIYDRTVSKEIKMKDDPLAAPDKAKTNAEQKRNLYLQEAKEFLQTTQRMLHQTTGGEDMNSSVERQNFPAGDEWSTRWYTATFHDRSAVQPMFEVLWCPLLATLSTILERTGSSGGIGVSSGSSSNSSASEYRRKRDAAVTLLCVDGYRYATRVAALFGMDTTRQAFVRSLKSFTNLGTTREIQVRLGPPTNSRHPLDNTIVSLVGNMKQPHYIAQPKNVQAIRALLKIAHDDGDHLKVCSLVYLP